MKLSFVRRRRTHARQLVVSLKRSEVLSTRKLRWHMMHAHQNLLTCDCDARRRRLSYDVEGLTSLRGYLKRSKVSHAAIVRMLVSMTQVEAWCMAGGNGCYQLLFDPSYVFVGTTWELHFAFLPVDEDASLIGNTPLVLLRWLSDDKVLQCSSPEATELARRLADFVDAQDGVFSLNALRTFVREECGEEIN